MGKTPQRDEARALEIAKIADLRVRGLSWTDVAEQFHYKNANSARASVTRHESWEKHYGAALDKYRRSDVPVTALTYNMVLIHEARDILRIAKEEVRPLTGPEQKLCDTAQRSTHVLLSHVARMEAAYLKLDIHAHSSVTLDSGLIDEITKQITAQTEKTVAALPAGSAGSDESTSDDSEPDGGEDTP